MHRIISIQHLLMRCGARMLGAHRGYGAKTPTSEMDPHGRREDDLGCNLGSGKMDKVWTRLAVEEEAGEAWLGTLKRRYRGFKISLDSGLGAAAAAPAAPCTANGGSAAGGLTQWFLSNTDTTPTTSTIQEEVSRSRAGLGWG